MMTWALSLVPSIAISVRILFTSHDRCWSVGSLPNLLCHLAICASASITGRLFHAECKHYKSEGTLT